MRLTQTLDAAFAATSTASREAGTIEEVAAIWKAALERCEHVLASLTQLRELHPQNVSDSLFRRVRAHRDAAASRYFVHS